LDGHIDVLNYLLDHKVQLLSTHKGYTLIHLASKNGLNHCIKRLLKMGSLDINALDAKGLTPLQHACQSNFFETCQLLLENGAILDQKILNWAFSWCNSEKYQKLLMLKQANEAVEVQESVSSYSPLRPRFN
jgi:ankyrin repeat protein